MKKGIYISLVIFICLPVCLPVFVFGADQGLLEVQSIPKLDPELAKLESVIGTWHGKGRIDAIYPQRIIINDSNYNMESDAALIYLDGTKYKKGLKTGMSVYYFLGTNRVIIKLAIDTIK